MLLQSPLPAVLKTYADHSQPNPSRRRDYRLRRRRRHGRQGAHRSRRQRPDARSGRDVRHPPRFEDDGVALPVAAPGPAHSRAPVRRVRRRLGRLDPRRRALHDRARRSVRLVPHAHARRTHQSLGPHLAAVRSRRLPPQEPRRPRRRLADQLRRSEAVLRQHRPLHRPLRIERRAAQRSGRHLPAAAKAALLRAADQAGIGAAEHPLHPDPAVDPDAAAQRPPGVSLLRPVRARLRLARQLLVALGAAAAGARHQPPDDRRPTRWRARSRSATTAWRPA